MARLLRAAAAALCAAGPARAASPGLRVAHVEAQVRDAPPPVWPKRFHASFSEISHGVNPFSSDTTSNGSYHYDFESGRELWSHGKGQTDNWCQCAGLKTDERCDILTDPKAGARVALFRTLSPPRCCTIGGFDIGFGPIRPDWLRLTNATFAVEKTYLGANGPRKCLEWASMKPGDWFMMVSDNWSQDEKGVPCRYVDTFKTWVRWTLRLKHEVVFDEASYGTEAEPDEVFAIPAGVDCSAKCPNKEGWCNSR